MGPDTYAVAQAEQLLALPSPPSMEIQRELLRQFLRNPFLDEDAQGLAVRIGMRRTELLEGLEALVEAGLLKEAGRRGFMLDLEALGPEIEHVDKMLPDPDVEVEAKGPDWAPINAALVELLPFGMVLLSAEGAQIAANTRIGQLLGLPVDELDAASFAARTGCDPVLVCAAGASTAFPLEDSSLEVQVHPRQYEEKSVIMIVVQQRGLQHEIAQAHAHIQEELFAQLNGEVAEPLQLIRAFLENSDSASLGTARAAFEQVEMFLQSFLLQVRSDD